MYVKRVPWPTAAERVLQAADCPLTAAEIARRAIFEGWVRTDSDWPSLSIHNAIAKHIKVGNSKGFKIIRRGPNKPALYWFIGRPYVARPMAATQ